MSTMKKIAAAVVFATAAMGAQAAGVTTWNLVDFNNDGLTSDFGFFAPPSGNSTNKFQAAVTTGNPLCGNGTTTCDPIAMNSGQIGTNVFTTGFNFSGMGVFAPKIANASGTGNIAADITGGVLTFSALDFAGSFGAATFYLAPNSLAAVSSVLTDLGGGNYGVVARYSSVINDPTSQFNGWQANWRLEGTMSTAVAAVPEAETYAMMLAGLGLIGTMVGRRRKTLG